MSKSGKAFSLKKKIFLISSSLMGTGFLFVATVPLWFNVDHYRPEIISVAQKFINGKVDMGKLSLSLWGKLRIKMEGLELTDSQNEKILSAKSIYAEMPIFSIFSLAPSLTLVMDSPEIRVLKDKKGKLNIFNAFYFPSKKEESEKIDKNKRGQIGVKSTSELPKFISRAQLNVKLKRARFFYLDAETDTQSNIKELNVEMTKVSLQKPFAIKVNANLDTRMGSSYAIIGPMEFLAHIDVKKGLGNFKLEAPGIQLETQVKLTSLEQPSGDIEILSQLIDLDQWATQGSEVSEVNKEQSSILSRTSITEASSKKSVDKNVSELKANPFVNNAAFNIKSNFKKITNKGISITDLRSQMSFKSGVLFLNSLNFNLLGGEGVGKGEVNLMTSVPSYQFSSEIKEVQLEQVMASKSEILKNLLKGKAYFQIAGKGQGFDPSLAKKQFSGKGTLKVTEARFATLDIGNLLAQGLGESLIKVFEQVPILRGKEISKMGPIESEYEIISSDFSIQNWVFDSPNFQARAKHGKGLDLKGHTQLNLDDCGVKADWQIIDRYNLTRIRDISIEQAGVKIEHILAQGNDPVVFPIQIKGTCKAPQVNYEAMTTALVKVALGNAAKGVAQQITQEISKKLGQELQKRAAKPLQDVLKGIFGK